MAEAVAGFYAVETVVEGAAVAGYAVSRPTVPLRARFKKLSLPKDRPDTITFKPSLYHSFNIVKGKGYVFGGDTTDGSQDSCMKVITLPLSLENGEGDLQIVESRAANRRPLQPYSDSALATEKDGFEKVGVPESTRGRKENQIPEPRAAHAATTIDSNIFVISGRTPQVLDTNGLVESTTSSTWFNCDVVHCFSTQTGDWTTLYANISQCKDGIPPRRVGASCAGTPSPQSIENVDITVHAHGTVFLHGGYDALGTPLRDTWAFSVSNRTWSKWPNLPAPSAMEVANEGRIIVRGATITRVGDGFGQVSHLDFETVQDQVVTTTSGPSEREIGLKPRTPTWETKTATKDILSDQPPTTTESLPMPRRNAGYVAITTGAGRFYNLYFMGQDGPESLLNDVWSYQVSPDVNSLASLKDSIRRVVGKGTGENEWARCEVVESNTPDDGPVEPLPTALSGFATDVWTDLGAGTVVLWGGRTSDGTVVNEGWVMTVE